MAGSSTIFIIAVLTPVVALLVGSVLCLVFKRRRRVPVAQDDNLDRYQLALPVHIAPKDNDSHPGIAITLSPPTALPDKDDPEKQAILGSSESPEPDSPRASNSGAKRQNSAGQRRDI